MRLFTSKASFVPSPTAFRFQRMAHSDRFMKVYQEIQTVLLKQAEQRHQMDPNRGRYLKEMMNVTCLGGKYNRGLCVVDVAECMSVSNGVDSRKREEVLHDACVCGWMIEMLQAHFLIEDDIMDHSTTRRGKPCWYLHPGVTTQVAINDGLIVLGWATQMAFHYFANRPYLLNILRVFHDVDMTTTIGQLYDVSMMQDSAKLDPYTSSPNTTDYVEYTLFNYRRIVIYKTAYYTYWLPLTMGLIVSESASKVDPKLVQRVSLLMGEYFQVQDDVMDCFTPPEKLGKIGTDIQDAKCSWLAVTFLESASSEQIETFKANYGSRDEDKVSIIKQLYRDCRLEDKFLSYEAGVASEVKGLIDELHRGSPAFAKSVEILWKKTYKRQK